MEEEAHFVFVCFREEKTSAYNDLTRKEIQKTSLDVYSVKTRSRPGIRGGLSKRIEVDFIPQVHELAYVIALFCVTDTPESSYETWKFTHVLATQAEALAARKEIENGGYKKLLDKGSSFGRAVIYPTLVMQD